MAGPDDWWHSLPEKRREQIQRWVTNSRHAFAHHPPTPGQRELFPTLDDHDQERDQ